MSRVFRGTEDCPSCYTRKFKYKYINQLHVKVVVLNRRHHHPSSKTTIFMKAAPKGQCLSYRKVPTVSSHLLFGRSASCEQRVYRSCLLVLLYLDLFVRGDHVSSFLLCWIFKPTNQLTSLLIKCVAKGYFVIKCLLCVLPSLTFSVSLFRPCLWWLLSLWYHCCYCCMWMFRVRVLRKVFKCKIEEVTGRWRKSV